MTDEARKALADYAIRSGVAELRRAAETGHDVQLGVWRHVTARLDSLMGFGSEGVRPINSAPRGSPSMRALDLLATATFVLPQVELPDGWTLVVRPLVQRVTLYGQEKRTAVVAEVWGPSDDVRLRAWCVDVADVD